MLGIWIPHCGFWNRGTGFAILCQWNLYSAFQSFGFRKLIMDSKAQDSWCISKLFRIPESELPYTKLVKGNYNDIGFFTSVPWRLANPFSLFSGKFQAQGTPWKRLLWRCRKGPGHFSGGPNCRDHFCPPLLALLQIGPAWNTVNVPITAVPNRAR